MSEFFIILRTYLSRITVYICVILNADNSKKYLFLIKPKLLVLFAKDLPKLHKPEFLKHFWVSFYKNIFFFHAENIWDLIS